MIVMPANCTGWFLMNLAIRSGKLGHLYSPGAQPGGAPWPFFPYALDCGVFALWDQKTNAFDNARWLSHGVHEWRQLLFWAQAAAHPLRNGEMVRQAPLWGIVPDRPGSWAHTVRKWGIYAPEVIACGIPPALAVQDGATVAKVKRLTPKPEIICVGGTTEWKWATAEMWLKAFPGRVHVLRCNSPEKIRWLEERGCMSCDGTGWNRGDRTQTRGLEDWAMEDPEPYTGPLWPFVSRARCSRQMSFA